MLRARLRTRIIVSFALVLVLVAILVTVTALGLSRVMGTGQRFVNEALPAARTVASIAEARVDAARAYWALPNQGIALDDRDALLHEFDAAMARIEAESAGFDALTHSPAVAQAWAALRGHLAEWSPLARAALDVQRERQAMLRQGVPADDPRLAALARRGLDTVFAARKAYRETGPAVIALRDAADQDVRERTLAAHQTARRAFTIVAVIVLCTTILLAVWLGRDIDAALRGISREANHLAEAVAAGRLDVRGDPRRVGPDFRPIVEGINRTMDAFVGPIHLAADHVARISNGEIPPPITEAYRGDFNVIKDGLNRCVDTLSGLVAETDRLAGAIADGRLAERAPAERHPGAFRRLLEGQNRALDALVGHLDAMPSPTLIVGRDHGVRYLNAAAAKMVGRPLADAIGVPCHALFRTDACNTERCVCARAMRTGEAASGTTRAHPTDDTSFDLACSGVPIHGANGAIVGAFEVVTDETAIQSAVRSSRKLAAYQEGETRKVTAALGQLARGDLGFRLEVGAAEPEMASAHETFARIAAALEESRCAVAALARDATALADAAVAGRLSMRADAGRHEGEFRKVVDGMNRTLDAVLAPMGEAVGVLERIATRDLRARVNGTFQGDYARLKEAVDTTAGELHDAIAQVSEAVGQVSSAAEQIAASSQAVASGAAQQAASLEETSRSVESLAATARDSAEHARTADGLARTARTAATEGAAAVEQLAGAMDRIRKSAEGTSQIIKDVSEIAFQTNLLALNAAVEAARAGEAGRGFAVVAEEVRSLALRAKDAATRTEALIRESVTEAEDGAGAARQAAGKLGEIVQGVSRVSDVVADITGAANAAASGVVQVTRAVGEMDKVTQQNAASAEQSSAAASELSGQAETLAAMVGTFQLAGGREDATAPARRPLPA